MNYSRMDGFYGSMLAAESLIDGTTILHGPGGCRVLASGISSRTVRRGFTTVEGEFFFHRSRIPCTFVDRDDYIYGASRKVAMILDMLGSDGVGFATVLESPGASLIGDKLQDEVIGRGMSDRVAVLGKCYMSETFAYGYDRTLKTMAEKLARKREKKKRTVNLVGLSHTARGCHHLVREMHGLLGAMGLEVTADIGPGCTVEQMRRSSSASANVCLCPEYFASCGRFYEEELGVPLVRGPLGAPVGYDALRAWFETVAEYTDTDCSEVLEVIDEDERDVDRTVESSLTMGEIMDFRTYSILGEASVTYPLANWLSKKMKMVPNAVVLSENDEAYEMALRKFLRRIGSEETLGKDIRDGYSDVVFGPGAMAAVMAEKGECRTAVDISVPSRERLDIMPRSIIGLAGCRVVADRVLNTR